MPESTGVIIHPFGIEADEQRNSDLLLQSIPGRLRLRGRLDPGRTARNNKGEEVVPQDQVIGLSGLPVIPGMQLHVNPDKLTYSVIDPLHGDEAMCGRITAWMKRKRVYRTGETIAGVPPKTGTLDVHYMKTLCREMRTLVNNGQARHVKGGGPVPDLVDVEDLPGKYLLNPGMEVGSSQPKFEEDLPAWIERLNSMVG